MTLHKFCSHILRTSACFPSHVIESFFIAYHCVFSNTIDSCSAAFLAVSTLTHSICTRDFLSLSLVVSLSHISVLHPAAIPFRHFIYQKFSFCLSGIVRAVFSRSSKQCAVENRLSRICLITGSIVRHFKVAYHRLYFSLQPLLHRAVTLHQCFRSHCPCSTSSTLLTVRCCLHSVAELLCPPAMFRSSFNRILYNIANQWEDEQVTDS